MGHEGSKVIYAMRYFNAFKITKENVRDLVLQMEMSQDKPVASQVRYDYPL